MIYFLSLPYINHQEYEITIHTIIFTTDCCQLLCAIGGQTGFSIEQNIRERKNV